MDIKIEWPFFQAIFFLSSHYHVFYPAEYNIFLLFRFIAT